MVDAVSKNLFWLCKPSPGSRKAMLFCYNPVSLAVDCGYLCSGSMSHPELVATLDELGLRPLICQSIGGLRSHYRRSLGAGFLSLDSDIVDYSTFVQVDQHDRSGSRPYRFLLGEFLTRKARRLQEKRDELALAEHCAQLEYYQSSARMSTWIDDYWAFVGDNADHDPLDIPDEECDDVF